MLLLDETTHTYRHEGQIVPSVTQLLSPLIDLSRIPAHVLEYKSQIGKAVHKATELDDQGMLDESTVDPVIVPYLAAWRKFKDDYQPSFIAIEQRLFHPLHRYAGQLDRVMLYGGDVYVADIKTVVSMSAVYGVQTAAYAELYNTNAGPVSQAKKRIAIQLKPTGDYWIENYTDSYDLSVFLSLLRIYQWRTKHGC